jgi:Glycosyl transferase 4-like domain
VTQNKEPIKILAVSFAYPPSALPRAVQVARLLKHAELETVLVCAKHQEKDVRQDPGLVKAEEQLVDCLRVPFSLSGAQNLMARVAYRFDLPVVNKVPDQYTSWKPAVMKRIEDYLRQTGFNPEALVSFGSPMSDHLIGLELKKNLRVPWLAHFSDPWADNPFARADRFTKAINLTLERRVLESVDRALFTSQETAALVMRKYPKQWSDKVTVIPHAFERADFETSSRPVPGEIVIRYLGDFYGPRTPIPLINALKTLLKRNPEALTNVRFETIGTLGDLRIEDLGIQDLPAGLMSIKPHVSYKESLALMSESSGLLVMDAPARESVFLPSKLIDYIGAGRPILGITPPGTAWRLIEELGGYVADPSKQKEVVKELERFVSYLRNDFVVSRWGEESVRSRFEAGCVARRFDDTVLALVKKNS